jgi:hypothetical protein
MITGSILFHIQQLEMLKECILLCVYHCTHIYIYIYGGKPEGRGFVSG